MSGIERRTLGNSKNKTKQNSPGKSVSNFKRANSAGMQVTISKVHLVAGIVNRGKRGSIKGS